MRTRSAALAITALCASFVLAAALSQRPPARAQTQPPATVDVDVAVQPMPPTTLPAVISNTGPLDVRKGDTLSSQLDQLHRVDAASRLAGHALTAADVPALPESLRAGVESKRLSLDAAGTVQVFVETAGEPNDSLPALTALGMSVERTGDAQRLIQGRIPIAALRQAADLGGVLSVRAPERGVVQAGTVTSQGDAILNAPALRSTFGADGSNVRVGIISDGMVGMNGPTGSIASLDLPAIVNTTTCNKAPSGSPTDPGAGAEGTAMAEIVHDVAPGAEIWFGYFNLALGTVANFQDAVNCLAQNTDVVLDDIGWFGVGPYDGTSSVSMNATNALNNASNRIRGYYTAVGNDAQKHYMDAYHNSGFTLTGNPGDSWVVHQYQANSTTTNAGFGLACNGAIPNCGDEVQLIAGGSMSVIVEWDDPFNASTNDYDLLFQDEFTGQLFLAAPDRQTGAGHNPVEGFFVSNTHGVTTNYDIIIGNYKGLAAPRTFNMFVNCSGCATYPTGARHNFNTTAGSVSNNSDAGGGVISSGAIDQADPGNDTIETFSGRGPTADSRIKPEITAIDGVSVTGHGGFPATFFGTSATSPHMGAIAALILTCKPTLKNGDIGDNPAADRTALRTALTGTAVDLGTAGTDNTFGAGRADAAAAALAGGCLPDGDGDGCPNARELGANHLQGGDRDPTSAFDFFDVPIPALSAANTVGARNRSVSIGDVISILFYIGTLDGGGTNANGVSYNTDINLNGVPDGQEYDRAGSSDPNKLWRSGPPSGAVSIADAITGLAQIGDTCAT